MDNRAATQAEIENRSMKNADKKWTWEKIAAMTVVACVVAACSAKLYVDKQIDDLLIARDLSEWNTNFAKKPGSLHRFEPALSLEARKALALEDRKAFDQALAIVRHNRSLGITPWSNLDKRQMELLLGDPPIELFRVNSYDRVPVYFDNNRKGFIVDFDQNNRSRTYPATLNDISPALESVAPKFHLKQSKYLPEIFGLDPAYLHEQIERPRSSWRHQIGGTF
jgi:hypothetical protein